MPFCFILFEHFYFAQSLPIMGQNKHNCSLCRLGTFLAINTSMDFGILLLRLGVGCMMLIHGIPKLALLLRGDWSNFPDPLSIGSFFSLLLCVIAEFGGSILILLGFLSRLATLLLIINMSVTLFLVIGLSGWHVQELAAIYLLIYLTLFYTGPGQFSLDAFLIRRNYRIEIE